MPRGLLIVVSGPSGVGKNTVISNLFSYSPNLKYSISATTRSPRQGEIDGLNYFFLSDSEFTKRIAAGDFLEWAKVYQHYYGTPRSYVEEMLTGGFDLVLDIDVQGAALIKKALPEAILVFLAPPSLNELKLRLMGRKTEMESEIMLRLQNIDKELHAVPEYDYFIVNREINLTCRQIEGIIQSERMKVSRQAPDFLDKIFQDE
ncbi:MAG TPA: guanylate kinase [Firmicutes bacterium]|jgi:guanylate kinase|nr:guanylate kinase [Bacillota bacterium]